MNWRDAVAMFLAISCAKHATEVYARFGFFAGVMAIIGLLTCGEVVRAWIRMLRGDGNGRR